MKKIKFLIEYGAYPIWLSYENGSEDCKLPPPNGKVMIT